MTKLILIIALMLPIVAIGQIKPKAPLNKVVPIKASKTVNNATDIDIVKTQAEVWFKKTYVANDFKYPSSYKLINTQIVSIDYKKFLEDSLFLAELDTALDDRADFFSKGKSIVLYEKKIKDWESLLAKSTNKTEIEKYERDIKTYKEFNISNKKYLLDVKNAFIKKKIEIERIQVILKSLTESEANKIYCYRITIECYSKNNDDEGGIKKYYFLFKDGAIVQNSYVNKSY